MEELELELVCILGFTGNKLNILKHHPCKEHLILFPIGKVLVCYDLQNPNNQYFFKDGHDENITILSISESGNLIATSQLPSNRERGNYATITVWNFGERKLIYQFRTHRNVYDLSFSHDDKYLVSIGEKRGHIWDLIENGERVATFNVRGKGNLIRFSPQLSNFNPKRPNYSIVYADNRVGKLAWTFDIKNMMNFHLSAEEFVYPGRMAGIKRTYTCLTIYKNNCFIGTRLGEVMIFDMTYNSFLTSLLVSSNGVYSITNRGDTIFTGGGDSSIKMLKRIKGTNQWRITCKMNDANNYVTSGYVTSLSHNYESDAEKLLLYAGTNNGKIIECSVQHNPSKEKAFGIKANKIICESHVDYITSISISNDCEYFLTTSKDGYVFHWSLSDYRILEYFKTCGYPTSSAYVNSSEFIIGSNNGFITCYDTKLKKNMKKWEIVNAHSGKVNCISVNTDIGSGLILSGGIDGGVRLFSYKSRELIGQFKDHKRNITGLVIDIKSFNIFHSCSTDKALFSYDLKKNKKIAYHSLAKNGLTSLSQKINGENEIVCGTVNGNILIYDIDYRDPIEKFSLGNRINSIDISPKTGDFLAVGRDDGILLIYSFVKKAVIVQGNIQCASITKVKWSKDEKQVISVGSDSSICIWNFYQF